MQSLNDTTETVNHIPRIWSHAKQFLLTFLNLTLDVVIFPVVKLTFLGNVGKASSALSIYIGRESSFQGSKCVLILMFVT